MKVGNTLLGVRSGVFSMATMLPMFGAMLPSAAAGLRPICVQVWPRLCTRACELMERTIEKSGMFLARFGKIPVGQRIPLMVSGALAEGVTPGVIFKSNVST